MSHSDSNFYKPFAFVLGALVLFTLFIMFVANMLSPESPDDPLALAAMKKSIAPVGQSRVAESAAASVAAPAAETKVEAVAEPVEVVVAETPAPEAPKTEAPKAETPEAETPKTVETEATEEVNTSDGSDAQQETNTVTPASTAAATGIATSEASMKVRATVATNCAGCHNVGLHGAAMTDDAAAWSALSEQGLDALTASVINGKGKMPARAESSLSDDEIRQAVQLMIGSATGETSASMSSGAAATATAATTAAAVAATATATSEVETSVAVEVPAAVKQVVDTTCAACHIAGVGNAPKFGATDDWARRMEKGLDALTARAIAGIGAMPPRGGSMLDDDQMKLAIEYMLTK